MKPKSAAVGQYIRNHVIPAGMSVTEAAARLGVGRPALSNLLNGRALLSPKMATRLQRAFGADREELLQLQAAEDGERIREDEKAVAVRGYVPSFLTIKARDIERWADSIDARSHLAVLLRKLVHATGRDLTRVDFPGFDDSERPGWDGRVEAGTATAWIPRGASGWEFGTSRKPRRKAESDYQKRLHLPLAEREQRAFVFVTPRRWPDKDDWAKAKEAQGDGWREVRAYDASDLEQWLEESVAAPIWLAEQLPMPVPGVRTLDRCWQDWAQPTDPPMTEHLFKPSVDACVDPFKAWLEKAPKQPFVVAADSKDEALAFLHCLFRHEAIADEHYDRAAVFASADTLATLAASSAPFIPIAESPEAERRMAVLRQRMHGIAMCPRNAVNVKPNFALRLLGAPAFHEGLAGMGFGRHEFGRLTRASGRSPTVLRRRRATIPALKTPPWAAKHALLAPLSLLGAWHVHSKADKSVVERLANRDHERVEKHVAKLLKIEDSPVWSAGSHRGVTSKIDTLYAVAARITEADVRNFIRVAEDVLKARDHSDALRDGILETLVLLSVHGDHLFKERLTIAAQEIVSALVTRLLTPLAERLESQERHLPSYAEAAPGQFLSILEDDLNTSEPAVLRLLTPVPSFGHCPRTGLLWAIECIAWNPDYLSRACVLLAKLSRVELDDNWMNKPIESLASILRSWMPQTAASLEERIGILKMLAHRFPDVGWRLCLGETETMKLVKGNYRPRWRSDADNSGGIPSVQDVQVFIQCAVSLLLSRPEHDQASLGDLVGIVESLPEERQVEVWGLIDAWATRADEDAVASVREQIRRRALMKVRRPGDGSAVDRARLTYRRLEPKTPTIRHAWLFADWRVREAADEIMEGKINTDAQRNRNESLRRTAMDEILAGAGIDGVLTMIEKGSDPYTLGHYAAPCVANLADVFRTCLASEIDASKVDAFMRPVIAQRANPAESDLLLDFCKQVGIEGSVRLWACAPFNEKTWRVLDRLSDEIRVGYWRMVSPPSWLPPEVEYSNAVEELLAVGRPQAAFSLVNYRLESIETGLLMRLMRAIATATGNAEPNVPPTESWYVSAALEALDARPGVTVQEMAGLELALIDALHHKKPGIPNLERLIAQSPAFFVQILAHCFQHKDGGQIALEWKIMDEARGRSVANRASHVLCRIASVPGTNDDGSVDRNELQSWLIEVRRLCAEKGLASIGDHQIGELLARAPEDDDGVWPCRAVCAAMEAVATADMESGFATGKQNMRGMFERVGEGGEMERELAAKYRRWAQYRRIDYPFAGQVLNRIAESYDEYARYQDGEAVLSKRLNTWD